MSKDVHNQKAQGQEAQEQGTHDQSSHGQDELLDQLYQQRKKQVVAPASIKTSVFAGLNRRDNNQQKNKHELMQELIQEINWFRLLSGVTLAASVMLFVGIISVTMRGWNTPENIKVVQIHSIDDTPQQTPSEQIGVNYQEYASEYANRTDNLERFHRKTMLLTHFDEGWELENCEDTVLQVSNGLLNMLSMMNSEEMLADTLPSGSWVEVYLDQHGHIMKIIESETPLHCSE